MIYLYTVGENHGLARHNRLLRVLCGPLPHPSVVPKSRLYRQQTGSRRPRGHHRG